MSYTLYWDRTSGSFCVEAILEELGLKWDKIVVDRATKQHHTEEFKKINPHSQVPVLKLPDGSFLTETVAICYYLAETHPEKHLLPEPGPLRAQALRFLVFMAANHYETVLRLYYPDRYTTSTDAGSIEGVKAAALKRLGDLHDTTEKLIKGPFALGDKYSVVDIYLLMVLAWNPKQAEILARNPKQKAIVDVVGKRPVIARVRKEHDMQR